MRGESDRAIQDCTKSIELDPKNVDAYVIRGLAYAKKGEKAKAIANYREALKLTNNPNKRKILEQLLRKPESQPYMQP